MSAKLNFVLILTLSIFVTGVGVYIIQRQLSAWITVIPEQKRQQLTLPDESSTLPIVPERSHYRTIPLESINSILQGSDPATLALNILDDVKYLEAMTQVDVAYPRPHQALVTITKVRQVKNNLVVAIKYRVEMSRFGRSILVSSPPVWEIIWAGSQVQCFSPSRYQNTISKNCD